MSKVENTFSPRLFFLLLPALFIMSFGASAEETIDSLETHIKMVFQGILQQADKQIHDRLKPNEDKIITCTINMFGKKSDIEEINKQYDKFKKYGPDDEMNDEDGNLFDTLNFHVSSKLVGCMRTIAPPR